jgi:transitional endoplasmic reticulum ATPase
MNQLFKEAKSKAPCVLCFDEFDAFAPDRASLSHSANLSGEVNEFLSQLNNIGNEKIFIIATTNNPEGIDPAVLRSGRIEHKFYIPAPDFEARKAVIKLATLNRPSAEGIDFDHLAKLTEGYVTSDLSLIVNDAAMNAAYARKFITQSMIEEAISNYRPSVSKEVINEHEEIRKRIESDTTTRNRIGFK